MSNDSAAAVAATVQALRRRRDRAFPSLCFADPEWNILLELFMQAARGRETCVTSLCMASGVPVSSALRCINGMIRQGVLVKVKDGEDRRRFLINMSEHAMANLRAVLAGS